MRAEGAFPLIGVGGIDSGGAALTKIRAGASLIQLYSSLVYKGLGLVDDIKNDLASTLLRTGRELAVGDRRRGCCDDHGRGLAGECRRLRLPNDVAQQRRIPQRLQPAARRIVHQQRAPQPGIAERSQRQPGGKEDQQRQPASGCACRAPRSRRYRCRQRQRRTRRAAARTSRTADNRARCARTSALAVMMSISAGPNSRKQAATASAKPKPQHDDELHGAGESRSVARADRRGRKAARRRWRGRRGRRRRPAGSC